MSSVLLAIDVGNSCTKCFGFDEAGTIVSRHTEPTDKAHPAELARRVMPFADDADVCIASVVPEANDALSRLGQHGRPLFVSDSLCLPVAIRYEVGRLGADRIAAACGVSVLHPATDCLVFDVGTALTMGVVLREGVFDGGLILAGPATSIRALGARASQLMESRLEPTAHLIARNTADALRAGFFHGYAAMVDGLAARAAQEYGRPFAVVLTGGGAVVLSKGLSVPHRVEPDLVALGLRRIYAMNRNPHGCVIRNRSRDSDL